MTYTAMITIRKPKTRKLFFKFQNLTTLQLEEPETITVKVINKDTDEEVFSEVLDHGVYKKDDNSFYYHYTFRTAGTFIVQFIGEVGDVVDSDLIEYKVE